MVRTAAEAAAEAMRAAVFGETSPGEGSPDAARLEQAAPPPERAAQARVGQSEELGDFLEAAGLL
ncbi:MAG: hypothetical protein ACKO5F_13885, partial [Synechococcus sp.]